MVDLKADAGGLTFRQPDKDTLLVSLAGVWTIGRDLPSAEEVRKRLESVSFRQMAFETPRPDQLGQCLINFPTQNPGIRRAEKNPNHGRRPSAGRPEAHRLSPGRSGAKRGAQGSEAGPIPGPDGRRRAAVFPVRGRDGGFYRGGRPGFSEPAPGPGPLPGLRLVSLSSGMRAEAFPIVSLISLLVGMILAFVAAIQLKLFGAQIFVADIVGSPWCGSWRRS